METVTVTRQVNIKGIVVTFSAEAEWRNDYKPFYAEIHRDTLKFNSNDNGMVENWLKEVRKNKSGYFVPKNRINIIQKLRNKFVTLYKSANEYFNINN